MSNRAFAVKAIDAGDFERWLPLWRAYQAFYEVDIPRTVSEETWRRFLDPGEPVFAAVAVRDSAAVGLVHWLFHRSTWSHSDSCYLQDLFVDPTVRGGGVGRLLIEHVHGAALARGATRLYWLTHETNVTAMRLYDRIAERNGFVEYEKRVMEQR